VRQSPRPQDNHERQDAPLQDRHSRRLEQGCRQSAPGGKVEALNWVTPDGITVKPL
jgi:methylmalonyl-CoA mutase